jgi:hypothetical protein
LGVVKKRSVAQTFFSTTTYADGTKFLPRAKEQCQYGAVFLAQKTIKNIDRIFFQAYIITFKVNRAQHTIPYRLAALRCGIF